jgi:hypothetical protein
MLDTYELRWFFETPVQAFHHWGGDREQRTDWYAPIWSQTSSVKLREFNIEAKFLSGNLKLPVGSTNLKVQHWKKLSQPLPSDSEQQIVGVATNHWLCLEKMRIVQHYGMVGGGICRIPDATDDSVQVEWSQITLDDRSDVWTLCLESPVDPGAAQMIEVLSHLRDQMNFDLSTFPQEQSYPSWIVEQVGTAVPDTKSAGASS